MAQVMIKGLSRIQANAIAMLFASGDMNEMLNSNPLIKDFFSSEGFKIVPVVQMAVNGDAKNPTHEVNYISEN